MELRRGQREGQWEAAFPRNDALCCSYEPHLLLANGGNVDWRPCMNLWAVVEYVTKYATKAPEGSRGLGEVLRSAMDEVCKYSEGVEGGDLMRRSLQKFYARSLGERSYGVMEAVHLGLGLPLIVPMMDVMPLNTWGTRALKTAQQLAQDDAEDPLLTWDSKVDN